MTRIPAWLPILLGFLTAVGPVSTDMYLPAFPAIEHSFGAAPGSVQITLATWSVGLAVGQLTMGTLSDRYGRRWPLLGGMLLYTAATAGCALSGGIFWLSVWRTLAAVGGSAGMVIPRAMVRDLADGNAAAKLMSRLMLVMGAAPILAPTLGGLLLGAGSWRLIFWVGFGYGLVCAALVWRLLPDTLPAGLRVRLGLSGMVARYVGIAREPVFATHVAIGACGMFAMFAYIAGSPPVLIGEFGLTPGQYAVMFGACAFGYITCAQVNARVRPRFGADALTRVPARVGLAAACVMAACAFAGTGGVAAVAGPIFVMMATMGFLLPNITVGALSRHPNRAASASALMGMIQFAMGAASGVLSGWLTDGTARGLACLMLAGTLGATIADVARRRVARAVSLVA